MADGPNKTDIHAIFKKLRSVPTNKQCFDCGSINPTWASVTYGVFLCIDCSAVHRGLGVHLTFIRSTQLDTNWTWLQLRAMQVGGNAAATAFFRQHGCTSTDAQQKYNSRAAAMYREKLHSMALKVMKQYGTKALIDSHGSDVVSPVAKDADFFQEHEKHAEQMLLQSTGSLQVGVATPEPVPIKNGSLNKESVEAELDPSEGPSVDVALSVSPTEAAQIAQPRKPTIGSRKPTGAKKGMGARKGGLGAQKVKTNFSDIESAAQQKDKHREDHEASRAAQLAETVTTEADKTESRRLAYKDISQDQKRADEKLRKLDPKKQAQAERLGMGFLSGNREITHSALTTMQTIDQENPSNSYDRVSRNRDFDDRFSSRGKDLELEDEFEMLGFSAGPPKYGDSPFGMKKDSYGGWGSSKSSSWDTSDRFDSKQSVLVEEIPSMEKDVDRGRSRKAYEVSSSEEAQQKFGNAKSISSEQYFGGRNPDFETKQNLQKFEGSTSISSADLFGNGQPRSGNYGGGGGTDFQDIKDGVKQGVTKVAGKLSSIANGVISSMQRN